MRLVALAAALLLASAGSQVSWAQETQYLEGAPTAAYATAVTVPPGYTTYYLSGTFAPVSNTNAPKDSVESHGGDITAQTHIVLNSLKGTLAKLGLTFADVVQAHVYMAPDPSKNGDIDFAGMNKAWLTEFGTPTQPHKPARVTIKAGLVGTGVLVEIEMTAMKKVAAK